MMNCLKLKLLRAGADGGIYFIFVILFLNIIASEFAAASASAQFNKEAVNGMEIRVSVYDVSEKRRRCEMIIYVWSTHNYRSSDLYTFLNSRLLILLITSNAVVSSFCQWRMEPKL